MVSKTSGCPGWLILTWGDLLTPGRWGLGRGGTLRDDFSHVLFELLQFG